MTRQSTSVRVRPLKEACVVAVGALLCAALLLAAREARAQQVGTIAAVEQAAEIGRAGAWMPVAPGTAVQVGDTLRTGPQGRLRVVFQDDSVVTMATSSELVVDRQLFAREEQSFRSLFRLLDGKVRAMVGEYYGTPGAAFEMETRTAAIGVRGTDFIALYDRPRQVTEVVGVSGRVVVGSPVALAGSSVVIGERELTSVAAGKLPTAPVRLEDAVFRQYLDGLEFVGRGRDESIAERLAEDGRISDEDRVSGLISRSSAPGQVFAVPGDDPAYVFPDVGTLLGQPPATVASPPGLGIRF